MASPVAAEAGPDALGLLAVGVHLGEQPGSSYILWRRLNVQAAATEHIARLADHRDHVVSGDRPIPGTPALPVAHDRDPVRRLAGSRGRKNARRKVTRPGRPVHLP